MSDLLPCPFCGGEPYLKGLSTNCFCMCMDCGAQSDDGSAERVTAAWNIRALPAVQPDAAAILQERPDSLDRVARAICLASYGDANPVPVPDELMPNAWKQLRDRYALLAEAAILALIDTGKEVMPDAAQSPPAGHDIGPGDQAVAGAAQDAILYGTGFMQGGKHVSPEDILAEPPPWPEGLIHLTNTRRFHVDCATEGCGRRVSTRFEGRDYCEPCGRKVALAQKGGE